MSLELASPDRPWLSDTRQQEYAGEIRSNLLRIVSITAFYAVELLNYHGLELGFLNLPRATDLTREFHVAVTALALTWTMLALGIHLCMRQQYLPSALKYISTGFDLVILTGILTLADGPRSPLLTGYFLILAVATLRFSLPLVRCSTAGAVLGYLFLLGYDRWYRVPAPVEFVPRSQQLIILVALTMTGIILGQVIRRAAAVGRAYAQRSNRSGSR